MPEFTSCDEKSVTDVNGLQSKRIVEQLRDAVHTSLEQHCTTHYGGQPLRYFHTSLLRGPVLLTSMGCKKPTFDKSVHDIFLELLSE